MDLIQTGEHTVTYDEVRRAMQNRPVRLTLSRSDSETVQKAVNQGIDSHLEACFVPDRGDRYDWVNGRLACDISPASLPVLLRRLCEHDAADLADFILDSLDCRAAEPPADPELEGYARRAAAAGSGFLDHDHGMDT